MYPISHGEDSLTFTDLRGRVDDDQSVELNLGLAHRFVTEDSLARLVPGMDVSDMSVVGYYGFFDRLESQFDNTFYQATAGAEYFTKDYSFRVNGYLPEDKTADAGSLPLTLVQTGTQIYFQSRTSREKPLPGFDLEAGRTWRYDWGQLYGRASYFHFDDSNAQKIAGSRLRAGVQVPGQSLHESLPKGSQFTLGAEWQSDEVRDAQSFGVVRMRVPFGSSVGSQGSGVESRNGNENRTSKIENSSPSSTSRSSATSPTRGEGTTSFSPSTGEKRKEGESTLRGSKDSRHTTQDSRLSAWQKDRLTERIERDVDIVTGQTSGSGAGTDTEPAVNVANGRPLNKVAFARADASGTGVASNPTSLPDALSRAGKNGLIVALPGGDTYTTDGLVLDEGQYLTGGQTTLALRPQGGETVHSLTVGSGGKAVLEEETDASTLLRVDTGTAGPTVRNFELAGGTTAIRGSDVGEVTVNKVDVRNTADNALHFKNAPNLKLREIDVRDAGNHGVYVSESKKMTARDITIHTAGGDGISVVDADTVTGSNISTYNTAGEGIEFRNINGGRMVLDDLSAYSTGGQGIHLSGENARVTNLSVQNSHMTGVHAALNNSLVRNVTVDTTATNNGIYVPSVNSLDLENVTIRNPRLNGLRLFGPSNVTVKDLTVDSAPLRGFYTSHSNNVILRNATLTRSGDVGMTVLDSKDVTLNDLEVKHTDKTGIELTEADTVTADSLKVADAGNHGLDLGGSNHTFTDISADSVSGDGVHLNAGESSLNEVTVTDAANDGVEVDADDVTLADVTVDDANKYGLNLDAQKNITLDGVSTNHTGSRGINVLNSDTVTVRDASVFDAGASGMVFGGSNHAYSDVSTDSTGQHGIVFGSPDVIADSVSVEDAEVNGVDLSANNVTLRDVTVDTAGFSGINMVGQKSVKVDGATVNNTDDDAVNVGSSRHITIRDLDAENVQRAIHVFLTSDVVADSVTVNQSTAEGFKASNSDTIVLNDYTSIDSEKGLVLDAAENVTATNLSISNPGSDGILVDDGSSDITVDTATVLDADGYGLRIVPNGQAISDVDISNVTVEGSNKGINVDAANVAAEDLSVTNVNDNAMTFSGSSHTHTDLSVHSVAGHGIRFGATNTGADSIAVTSTAQDGVEVDANNVALSKMAVTDAGNDGLGLTDADSVSLTGIDVTKSGGNGIQLDDSSEVTMNDVTIDTSNSHAVRLTGASDTVSMDSVAITHTSTGDGIRIDGPTTDFTLTDATVRKTAGAGLYSFNAADSGVTLRDVTVERTGGAGIHLEEGQHLTLEDVTVNRAVGGRGLNIWNADTVTLETVSVRDIPNHTGMWLTGLNNTYAHELAASNVANGIRFGGENLIFKNVSVDSSGHHGVQVGRGDQVEIEGMDVSNVDRAGLVLSDSVDNVTFELLSTTISNADTGVLVDLRANGDGIQNPDFGPPLQFEVKSSVDTVFSAIGSTEQLIDPSGLISAPAGNLSCSIEGTVTGSTLVLDNVSSTKTVNNANCP